MNIREFHVADAYETVALFDADLPGFVASMLDYMQSLIEREFNGLVTRPLVVTLTTRRSSLILLTWSTGSGW